MSDSTVNTLTVLNDIKLTPSGSQAAVFCVGTDLEISSEKQVKFTPQNGVRILGGTPTALTVDGDTKIGGKLTVGDITPRAQLDSPQGAALSAIGVGIGAVPPHAINIPVLPWPYETISTLSQTFNLRFYSYNSINFHTKDASAVKMSLDQNGNLAIKGTLQVGKNITFDNGLTVDTTYKSTVDATNDGYGGTPTTPGARHPLNILNNLNNNNSLVIELDGSNASAGNLVLWWKSNGKKYKAALVGTPV